jgi:hypothetical protein
MKRRMGSSSHPARPAPVIPGDERSLANIGDTADHIDAVAAVAERGGLFIDQGGV